MGVKVVPGRTWSGLLALAGAIALAPSIIWPTARVVYRPEVSFSVDPAEGFEDLPQPQEFVQLVWSWGRFELADPPAGVEQGPIMANTPLLALLIAVVVVGLAAAALLLLVPGVHARTLGAIGATVVGTYALHSLVQRVGQAGSGWFGPEAGTSVEDTAAGVLEAMSVVLLALAVVVLAWRPGVVVGRRVWQQAAARAAEARAVEDRAPTSGRSGAGGVIVHGERTQATPLAESSRPTASEPAEPVGFTDASPDDDWFRNPGRT